MSLENRLELADLHPRLEVDSIYFSHAKALHTRAVTMKDFLVLFLSVMNFAWKESVSSRFFFLRQKNNQKKKTTKKRQKTK